MPIKPVTGKIESQELNDNFSYLESIFKTTSSGSPKGTYATLSDLQAAFPAGNNNIYVVRADGNWYYWNGATWASGGIYQSAGLPDDLAFKATNLMKNGDFSNGTTGWTAQGGTASVAANTLSVTGNGTLGLVGTYNAVGYRYLGKAGHKVYMRARVRVTNATANSLRIYASDGTTNVYLNGVTNAVASPQQDLWYNISGIIEHPTSFDGKDIRHFILAGYASPTESNGKTMQLFRPLAINLTDVFGEGNEPSSEEMDEILSKYDNSWFDGTSDILSIKKYIQDMNTRLSELQAAEVQKKPYQLFDDLSSSWVAEDTNTTTSTKDKTKVLTGTESLKITVTGAAVTSKAVDRKNISWSLAGKSKQIMLKIWVEDPAKINEVNFYVGNEAETWGNYCRMRFPGGVAAGGQLRKGWNFLAVIPGEMIYTNNFSWDTTIKRIRFTVTPSSADPATIIVDSIWYDGTGTPKLVITFDDAWKTVYQNAYPAMKSRGIKGTTYVIGQYVDNPSNPLSPDFCTLNELKELYANGWTLGNHTWQHNYYFGGGHTPESYLATINQNRDWLLGRELGEGGWHVCYPNGEYDLGVIALLRAYGYKSARAAKVRGAHPIKIDDEFQLLSRNFHKDVTLDQAKKWVDYCIESGGTTYFQFHQIPIDDTTANGNENPAISWSKAKFEGLMDYIVLKGMENNCLTHEEWYDQLPKNT